MSMIEADMMSRLCRRFDIAPAAVKCEQVGNVEVPKDREIATAVNQYAVMRLATSATFADSQFWPSKRELRQLVNRKMRSSMGVFTFLLWAWRIAGWVNFIWETWAEESGREAG